MFWDSSDHGSPKAWGEDLLLSTCLAGPQPELGVRLSLLGVPAIHCGPRLWVGEESVGRNVFWPPTGSYQGFE